MINQMLKLRNELKTINPLIHCITNPISINDCANAVLAVGCKPIMAEHPKEVSEITKIAKALAVNLGSITDARMESMMISGKVALQNQTPTIIDIVGVACSTLRLDFAKKYIVNNKPNVIKGNMSEIKSLSGECTNAVGIDVGINDAITEENIHQNISILKNLSQSTGSIIVATGETDIIASENKVILVKNGSKMLSEITGTGCMLNVLIGSFISTKKLLTGTVLATIMLGIAGELAYTSAGTGSFKVRLMDALYTMTDEELIERIKIKEVE